MRFLLALSIYVTASLGCVWAAGLDCAKLKPAKVAEGIWSAPDHTLSSERFDIFWGDARSAEPWADFPSSDKKRHFDPRVVMEYMEHHWKVAVDEMRLFTGEHFMPRDRIRVVIKGTWKAKGSYDNEFWAVGFGLSEGKGDEKRMVGGHIGVYPTAAMNEYVISHELTHVLQGYIKNDCDPAKGPPADIRKTFDMSHESHADFVPIITLDGKTNSKCVNTLLTKHLRPGFRRPYQNWVWMLFLYEKEPESGLFGKVWHTYSAYGIHPFEAVRQEKKMDAAALADYWFEYAQRNVTGDYKFPHVRNTIAKISAGKDRDKLTVRMQPVSGKSGTFTVPAEFVPQRFGYNHVLLRPLGRKDGSPHTIQVGLEGGPCEDKSADWRFGFCVVDDKDQPRYSKPTVPGQQASVTLAAADKQVYLVVMATPRVIAPFSKNEPADAEIPRYPYTVQIQGAEPDGQSGAPAPQAH